jgi:adenylate cyclase
MGVEIERKFLLRSDAWRAAVASSTRLRQGYLANTAHASVRVRRAGDTAWLSVKSMTAALTRHEYEYAIPPDDADAMLDRLCEGPRIDKIRHLVTVAGHVWEIDEFLGDNAGLVVAELELDAEDEAFVTPPWLGAEVTREERYYNFRLAAYPYSRWSADERAPPVVAPVEA